MIQSVTIIGAGNIAVHLLKRLKSAGLDQLVAYSRSDDFSGVPENIKPLLTNDPQIFHKRTDLFIIAVKDDSIAEVAGKVKDHGQIVVHTSGSTSIKALERFSNYGVIYPLQTFSKDRALSWDQIPVFIEASDGNTKQEISTFANKLTSSIHYKNSEERRKLHISAVFVSNFVNHMFVQGKELADHQGVDFSLFMPLIHETVNKSFAMDPLKAQTGPALRNDKVTLKKHLEALKKDPDKFQLYELISEAIFRKGKKP